MRVHGITLGLLSPAYAMNNVKDASKCDMHCDLQITVSKLDFERIYAYAMNNVKDAAPTD